VAEWQVASRVQPPACQCGPDDAQLVAGQAGSIAFAVWNGSNQEVGARKQLSSWVTLQLQGTGTTAAAQGQPAAVTQPIQGVSQLTVLLLFLGTLVATAIVTGIFVKAVQETKK